MGLGLPFRDGTFDGAISVSALQWLCYDNSSQQSASRRLGRFFSSLYRALKSGSRAALQFYPENDAQAALIATAAARAGFTGGVVVDYPNSTKAKKHYLCLSMDRHYAKPDAHAERPNKQQRNKGDANNVVVQGQHHARQQPRKRPKGKRPTKDKQWVLQKKDFQRKQGRAVKDDSKYTGRKRKDRF